MNRVVLAETNVPTRRRLTRILRHQEFQVSSTGDGREALERIRATQPDLVVLDLRMREISGLEVLRRIRGHDPELPVIILSAEPTDEVRAALRLGPTDYVEKPIDPVLFRHRVRLLLESAARRQTGPASPSLSRSIRVTLPELHDPAGFDGSHGCLAVRRSGGGPDGFRAAARLGQNQEEPEHRISHNREPPARLENGFS